jgi:hypothetical protein
MSARISVLILAVLSSLAFSAQAQTGSDGPPDEARFTVTKDFTDGNPAGVDVTLDCFDGLPITQTQTVTEAQSVTFTVHSFGQGDLDCIATESDSTGYVGLYFTDYYYYYDRSEPNGGDESLINCSWSELGGGEYLCNIINTPKDVLVTVTKDWLIDGVGGDEIDSRYELLLVCDNPIDGGYYYDYYRGSNDSWYYWLTGEYYADGTDTVEYTAYVTPDWDDGTNCYVDEYTSDSAVDSSDTCGSLLLELDGGDSCTVTNEVFFEGIPSLNQYGLAILALFMLSIGFVGFRRFV